MTKRQDGGPPVEGRNGQPHGTSADVSNVHYLPGPGRFHDEHVAADIEGSGITREWAEKLGWFSTNDQPALRQLAGKSPKARTKYGATLVFPFYDPLSGNMVGSRFKPELRPVNKAGKQAPKYMQSWADGVLVYFPRTIDLAAWKDITRPVIFVEGEKKAGALAMLGFVVVGLCGVWNFMPARDARTDEHASELHPAILQAVALAGRECVLVFDADARTNDKVMHALRTLAGLLEKHGAAAVKMAIPPRPENKTGIDDYLVSDGEDAVRALIAGAAPVLDPIDPSDPLPKVGELKALRDAPESVRGLRWPAGYELAKRGELLVDAGESGVKEVARGPVLLSRWLADYNTGERAAEVVFRLPSRRWATVQVDARAIVDKSHMLAALAPHGAPVTSNNAGALITFLDQLVAANPSIPEVRAVSRVGWHQLGDRRVFVLDEPIGADGEAVDGLVVPKGARAPVFRSLGTAGDPQAQLDALAEAWNADDVCAVFICSAFAAPLLELVDAPNFAVHVPGESTGGKTSALMFAASVWGNPDPESGKMIQSWNATTNAVAGRAAQMSGLPLCCDEVGATDRRELQRAIYTVVNGLERGRLNRHSELRAAKQWHTILLSTGEHNLVTQQDNTGAQVRVVQMRLTTIGRSLGGAAGVDRVREALCANYGHAGRVWLRAVMGGLDMDDLRRGHRNFVGQYRQEAADRAADRFSARQAGFFGLLAMVEATLHRVLGLGGSRGETMLKAFGRTDREAITTVAQRARHCVEDWVVSDPGQFVELIEGPHGQKLPDKVSHAGISGLDHLGCLWLVPTRLRERLERAGISYEQALNEWDAAGELRRKPGRHMTRLIKIDGKPRRMICVSFGTDTAG